MKSIFIALVVWFLLRTFLVEAFRIPSGSMENTLLVGDFLFVNKAVYGAEVPLVKKRLPAFREPRRGDVLVFDSVEEEGLKVVKRLIGMPGDTSEHGARRAVPERTGHPRAVRQARGSDQVGRSDAARQDAAVAGAAPGRAGTLRPTILICRTGDPSWFPGTRFS